MPALLRARILSALFSSVLFFITAIPFPALSAPVRKADAARPESLDRKVIHDQYNEGNFDAVIGSLESFIKRNHSYLHDDSVFIAKHLAVVYSANPATREKGRYYMHRLLELLPSAKLVDMYVSEEIDRIFEKVREEYLTRQNSFGVDTSRIALPDRKAGNPSGGAAATAGSGDGARPGQARDPARKSGSKTGFWIAGGTAVVAAGLTAAYLIHASEEEPNLSYRVPR